MAGFLAAETLEGLTVVRSWARGRAPSAGLAWLALPAGTGGGSSRPFLVSWLSGVCVRGWGGGLGAGGRDPMGSGGAG